MSCANDSAWLGSEARARRGIWQPQEDKLRPRTDPVVFRFVDIRELPKTAPWTGAAGAPTPPASDASNVLPHVLAANSPWWFRRDEFRKIQRFADEHDYSLDDSARINGAILFEYSQTTRDITGYVTARVLAPLRVWEGVGRAVQPTTVDGHGTPKDPRDYQVGARPPGGPHAVRQVFIPGLFPGGTLLPQLLGDVTYFSLDPGGRPRRYGVPGSGI